MDVSLIADPVTLATKQALGLGFSNSLIPRDNFISAAISDVLSVKSSSTRTIRRTLLRKKRRTRRKTYSGGESGDSGEELVFFGGDGDGNIGGGGSWGGGGGGGGGGWNFHRFGGQNWDESSWSPSSEFAYGFVYEVIYWIALSTCLHFAFEKGMRMIGGGIGDTDREKVPMRLTSVC